MFFLLPLSVFKRAGKIPFRLKRSVLKVNICAYSPEIDVSGMQMFENNILI